jgi:hypothetical protein
MEFGIGASSGRNVGSCSKRDAATSSDHEQPSPCVGRKGNRGRTDGLAAIFNGDYPRFFLNNRGKNSKTTISPKE